MESVEQAGGHSGTELAPFIWRYGIYMPAREGGSGREAGKIAKIIEKHGGEAIHGFVLQLQGLLQLNHQLKKKMVCCFCNLPFEFFRQPFCLPVH